MLCKLPGGSSVQMSGQSLGAKLPEQVIFGLHWLDLTFHPEHITKEDAISHIQYAVNLYLLGLNGFIPTDLWEFHNWGQNCYRSHASTANGIKLFWDNVNDKTGLHLTVPGSALDNIFYCDIEHLFHYLRDNVGFIRCTRLDLAWDNCPFTVGMIGEQSIKRGGLRCRAHDAIWLGRFRLRGKKKEKLEDGESVIIGSISSNRFCRIYDGRGFVRLELVLRQERADYVFQCLMGHYNVGQGGSIQEIAIGFLRDFLDFVDRSSSSNISRCSLLSWWSIFVKLTPVIRQKIQRVAMSLQRSKTWISKAVAPTMAALFQAMGDCFPDWIGAQIDVAHNRLNAAHRRLISEASIASS